MKYFSNLPSSPLCSSASGGSSPFWVILGPLLGVGTVELEPLLHARLGVGKDRLARAFRLAYAAVDAFVRADDQHHIALVEAVDGTDLDAILVFAFDALIVDDVGHLSFPWAGWLLAAGRAVREAEPTQHLLARDAALAITDVNKADDPPEQARLVIV